jgi:hypothetical protein
MQAEQPQPEPNEPVDWTAVTVAIGALSFPLGGVLMWAGAGQQLDIGIDESFRLFLYGLMIFAGPVLLMIAIRLARHWWMRKPLPGVCVKCGYDLRGLPEKPDLTCPECGCGVHEKG